MIVLGLDTSTAATAAALRMDDGRTLQARDDPPEGAHPGHATRLLGMARELLELEGLGWDAVERVAVGVGPGTFTGLRVGVASARGLAQSLSAEIVAVSSLQALAHGALEDQPGEGRPARAILAVIDARRGEVFAAAYARNGAQAPTELLAPRAVSPDLLGGLIAEAERGLGDEWRGCWLALGDGAVRYAEQLREFGVPGAPGDSALQLVSASAICELGALGPPCALEEVLPDYRRRPDAELALHSTGTVRGSER